MGTIQQTSLWFNIKLSESLTFTPPTRLEIYEFNSKERHFHGRILPNERPKIIRDLVEYIHREFQIASPISLCGSNGNTFKNSESVNTLPEYCTLLVCPANATNKDISTPTQPAPVLNCSASAISTELNASTTVSVTSVDPNRINPVMNDARLNCADFSDSDSNVNDTSSNNTTLEEIPRTVTMGKSVCSATSMSFANWEFLDVQRRLQTFMNEANIEKRQNLKKWLLEFYETFEPKGSTSANTTAARHVPCSRVGTNESEITLVSKTIFNDPASHLAETVTGATTSAFPSIANKPINNSNNSISLSPRSGSRDTGDTTETHLPAALSSNTRLQGRSCRVNSRRSKFPEVPVKKSKIRIKQRRNQPGSKTKKLRAVKSDVKKHSCSYASCSFKVRCETLLKNHLGKVHNETPFGCNKCDKEFRCYNTYRRHLTTHQENHKFTCSFTSCTYTTFRGGDLRRHMMTHSGEKPVKCSHCEHRCSRNDNLKRHVYHHHGIQN